jgi:4-methyl-5(b-hydroxyethyl)-thiazole monophosphate biosynthesis
MSKSVLVIIAHGSEELEAVTVIDLLRRAQIQVTVASLDGEAVTCSRGVNISPDASLDEALSHTFDLIVLPGGLPGADHLANDDRVIALLQQQAEHQRLTAAICAAPKVLVKAGVVRDKTITAYPGAISLTESDQVTLTEQAVCEDGLVVTSRGPGTAMDFALTLIERLEGKSARDAVELPLKR